MRLPLPLILCILAIVQSSTATPPEPVAEDQSQNVIKLVELLTRDNDSVALERARWLLMTGKSPSQVMDPTEKSPGQVPQDWDIPRIQNEALFDLGEYLMAHRAQFPNGLPDLPKQVNAFRLCPLIDAISRVYNTDQSETDAVLSNLITETWLEAADRSGQSWFSNRIRIYRGQLPELLRSAENAGDDFAIVALGLSARRNPAATRNISPELFRSHTLALFISGVLNSPETWVSEAEIASAYQTWPEAHPTLLSELKQLRGDDLQVAPEEQLSERH